MEFDNATNLDRKSGTWEMMTCFDCFQWRAQLRLPAPFQYRHGKAMVGASPRLFRPTYAGANVGHPALAGKVIIGLGRFFGL